jgi:hypothetical protein
MRIIRLHLPADEKKGQRIDPPPELRRDAAPAAA